MEAAIRAYNAGQVRSWRQLSELIMLTSENKEAAIRAYHAGQVRLGQLSELIMLDK